jgi:hypothetical protein
MRPKKPGRALLISRDLKLFVALREVQALQAGSMAIFISEFTASSREHQDGITITQVGRAGDMPSAVTDAVAHWLELFTSKFNDGSVEATCRWGNRDWLPGKNVLAEVA